MSTGRANGEKSIPQIRPVIRVRTRETIASPEVAQLIMRGARASGLPTPAAALAELVEHVASHSVGIFLGLQKEVMQHRSERETSLRSTSGLDNAMPPVKAGGSIPVAVVVAHLPTSAFDLAPVISLAYSERRDRALHREIGERLRGWLLECGHDRAIAANLLHTDRAFLRGFGHFGAGERVGSVIEFRL